jgi:hypothetical protein
LRKIKNDQLKVEAKAKAKAKGEVISTKRKPEGPKPGFMVEGAIHWKQYSNHTMLFLISREDTSHLEFDHFFVFIEMFLFNFK